MAQPYAGDAVSEAPGRSCPLAYRYSPAVFNRPPEIAAQTLYVVGGLYGNLEALHTIEAMFAREGAESAIVFNGDFHWFDADPDQFHALNQRVLRHHALRGNVETELAKDDASAGCGCAYPDSVDDADVERSNAILQRLRQAAQALGAERTALGQLPMHAVARVGEARVALVHGDAESLAGWRFDAAALGRTDNKNWLKKVFDEAQVDIFASSHTCAPGMKVLERAWGITQIVVNNGAAGMASFPGSTFGAITRISLQPAPHGVQVLSEKSVAGVRVQAIKVAFDDQAWQRRFLSLWPPGSPAHTSYWQRIVSGPVASSECATAAAVQA